MTDERLTDIKTRLIQLREEMREEMRRKNAQAAALADDGVPDTADLGATDSLREFLHLLSDSKREELIRIDDALDRIEQGIYGLCLDCEEPIDLQRLQIRPHTRYCVSCKEDLETLSGSRGGPGRGPG